MTLTKDFQETLRERVRREPGFRRALLREAIKQLLSLDVATGKALVRHYLNASVWPRWKS